MSVATSGALVLVDLQADFLSRPGLEPHADSVTAGARRWLQDWRAKKLSVAHVLTQVSRAEDKRMPHWRKSGLWMCEHGSPGALPASGLEPAPGEPLFLKSGYLPDEPTELAIWLKQQGATRVVLAGVMTHACVAHLAAALLSRGFEVAWASGAIGSDRPQAAAHVVSHLAAKGVRDADPASGLFNEEQREQENADDVPRLVAETRSALRAAPPTWADTRPCLLAWADRIDAAREELALAVVKAVGKPVAMAREEARHAANSVRDAVRWRDAFREARDAGRGGVSLRRPLGIVAVLTPWNNPLSIPVGRLAPALAYGNAALWKPSPAVEEVSRRLLELALEAGLRGELARICSGGATTGRLLVGHAGVDAITFSGSLARGRLVLAEAAERLAPCQLEMGGNNAAIVADDADAAAAADAVLAGAFGFAGQRCTANRRVILPPAARDTFLIRARAALADWAPGDPLDERCRMGPVKDAASAVRIESLLARAERAGARVTRAARPDRFADDARYVAPAIVEGAAEDSEIVREETFGPVLVVQEARDMTDALRLLNAVPQGLAAAMFTDSRACWERFAAEANAGVLRRNQATAGALDDLPFGGWKASGFGGAEHAEADELFFTRPQARIETHAG